MAVYICMECSKELAELRNKVRCKYCGNKMLAKKRVTVSKLLAR